MDIEVAHYMAPNAVAVEDEAAICALAQRFEEWKTLVYHIRDTMVERDLIAVA